MDMQEVKRNYKVYVILGILCLAISAVLPGGGSETSAVRLTAMFFTLAGIVLVGTGFLVMKKQGLVLFDERYILHRLKATRFALITGMIAIFALLIHSQITEKIVRWDLLLVLLAIAVGKIAAMIYYTHAE